MKIFLILLALLSASSFASAQNKVPVFENDAGFVAVGAIANVAGIGFYLVGSELFASSKANSALAWSLHLSGIFAVPIGYLGSGISYAHMIDTYNLQFPGDAQNAGPFLALTLAGTAATFPLIFGGDADRRRAVSPQEIERRNVLTGIAFAGLAAHVTGMVIAVVHSQEIVAKVKVSENATNKAPQTDAKAQAILRPQVGLGYLGVVISMP